MARAALLIKAMQDDPDKAYFLIPERRASEIQLIDFQRQVIFRPNNSVPGRGRHGGFVITSQPATAIEPSSVLNQ